MPTDETLSLVDRELAALEGAIAAQYDIVRPLGRGGMGAVYLARERLLDRLVAIKVLRSDQQLDDESRERFLREARTAARLTHPNIVPLYSFGQSGDTVFYVMGYVDGESLDAYLKRAGKLTSTEAARILAEIADALDYAHRSGIVHRDIKPDNVLIERGSGRAILTDFGIAKLRDIGGGLTRTGVIVGTPQYMSPEQGAGARELDGRSDIYSLGVLGYRMIAGRLPFEATTLHEYLAQHASRAPLPLAMIASDTDAALAAAVMRCLEKNPENRWGSAGTFRDEIADASRRDKIALPEHIGHLPSHGIHLFFAWWCVSAVAAASYGATRRWDWFLFLPFTAILCGLAFIPTLVVARRAGIRWKRAFALAFAPPAWWPGWWPKRLRRPGDVWERLPEPVRQLRGIGTLTYGLQLGIMLPILATVFIHRMASPEPWILGSTLPWVFGIYVAIPFLATPAALRLTKWAKALGLPKEVRKRLGTERTWGSKFWSRPEVEVVLGPDTPSTMSDAAPRTVSALLADIEHAAADVGRFDSRLADDVRMIAREVGAALSAMEKEIVDLEAGVQLGEVQRLAERLETASVPDDPAMRQMRTLVANQLELMKGLQERQRLLERRRDRAFASLQTLWLQLRALRAQRAGGAADASEITGRIRALCADVANLNTAVGEVNAVVER